MLYMLVMPTDWLAKAYLTPFPGPHHGTKHIITYGHNSTSRKSCLRFPTWAVRNKYPFPSLQTSQLALSPSPLQFSKVSQSILMCQAGCRSWGSKGKQVPAFKEFNSQPMPFTVPVHTL